jgi:hypothetical protein
VKHRIKIGTVLMYFLVGTGLSILVFFSISFVAVIYGLRAFDPYTEVGVSRFQIGFPLTYYSETYFPGSSYNPINWNALNLLVDCFSTWLVVTLPYTLIKSRIKHLEIQ